jgi:glucose-1-phosphate thymidylyltransferase
MKKKGAIFVPGEVEEWLDCGNKDNMVQTNQRYLEIIKDQKLVSDKAKIVNSILIPPVFIGEHVVIENSIIGPYVSISEGTTIVDSRISNSIIQKHSQLKKGILDNSLLGNFVNFEGNSSELDLGDYSTI